MESELMIEQNTQEATPFQKTMQMKERLKDYRMYKEDLIDTAKVARDRAVSHRNFQVGCALMVEAPEGKGAKSGIYFGFNFKPEPGEIKGRPKPCAERRAFDWVLKDAQQKDSPPLIIAIVTVSRELSTGDATKAHDALHPCLECLGMLADYKESGLLRGDSVICCVNDAKGTREEMTIDELLDLYKKELHALKKLKGVA